MDKDELIIPEVEETAPVQGYWRDGMFFKQEDIDSGEIDFMDRDQW